MGPGAEGGAARREPAEPRASLTEEEVRELLGEGGQESRPAAAPPRRMLIVSRDEEEARLVRGVLQSLHIESVRVRNNFSALDAIRQGRYDAVISDLELWASHGRLLFHRLAQAHFRPAVVFLCGSAGEADAARLAGADIALAKPLTPGQLAEAVAVLPAPLDGDEAPADLPGADLPGGRGRRPLEEAAPEGEAEGREAPPRRAVHASRTPPPGPPPGSFPGASAAAAVIPPGQGTASASGDSTGTEARWLRFFFEARRALRAAPGPLERLEAVLEAFERLLGPRACGVAMALHDRIQVLARPGSREALDLLVSALEAARREEETGFGGSLPAGTLLRLFGARAGRGVFAALPGGAASPGSGMGDVPETFLEELSSLLEETGDHLRSPAPREAETLER